MPSRTVDPSISRTPLPLDANNLATVCVLCSHNCGLRVDVADGRIVAVRADESSPISGGYICNKGFSIGHYVEHKQRVEHPLKRRADGTFERIGWEQAIAEIAAKLSAIRAASERGAARRVSILTGNGGGLFLTEELLRGADGAMTGFAWPEMMVGVCEAHAAGDADRAQDLFDAYLPLARYEQQPGIGLAVRKHILAARGVIASAHIRRPGPALSAADVEDIVRLTARQRRRLAQLGA